MSGCAAAGGGGGTSSTCLWTKNSHPIFCCFTFVPAQLGRFNLEPTGARSRLFVSSALRGVQQGRDGQRQDTQGRGKLPFAGCGVLLSAHRRSPPAAHPALVRSWPQEECAPAWPQEELAAAMQAIVVPRSKLAIAAEAGNARQVQELLAAGEDPNQAGAGGNAPIHLPSCQESAP